MSTPTRTAPAARPALTLVSCDEATGIVAYAAPSAHDAAPSAHDAARVNVVSLDTTNGDILCDCAAAEFGRACWHEAAVAFAWRTSAPMLAARALTHEDLLRRGKKLRRLVDSYRAAGGSALPEDEAGLIAARCVWRERAGFRRPADRRERAVARDGEAVALAA